MRPAWLSPLFVACLCWISCGEPQPPRDPVPPNEPVANSAATAPFSIAQSYRRLSYPYGTIEITPDSVKFVEGEGMAEPPRFLAYRLADRCPYTEEEPPAGRRYLVLPRPGSCEAFDLRGDTLLMYYPPGDATVAYLRQR